MRLYPPFVNQVPIRASEDVLSVNWLKLTITHEQTGKQRYHYRFLFKAKYQ